MSQGTWPCYDFLDQSGSYHWLHAERSMSPAIAQWVGNVWHCIGEERPITPQEMRRRGWEYLGPAERNTEALFSRYLDG